MNTITNKKSNQFSEVWVGRKNKKSLIASESLSIRGQMLGQDNN
jgi:hypothetical protein